MGKTMNKSGAEMEMRNDTNVMTTMWEKEECHHNQHSWISCCIRCDVRFTEWKNNEIYRWTNLSIFRFGFWIIQIHTHMHTHTHRDTGRSRDSEIELNRISFGSHFDIFDSFDVFYCIIWFGFCFCLFIVHI